MAGILLKRIAARGRVLEGNSTNRRVSSNMGWTQKPINRTDELNAHKTTCSRKLMKRAPRADSGRPQDYAVLKKKKRERYTASLDDILLSLGSLDQFSLTQIQHKVALLLEAKLPASVQIRSECTATLSLMLLGVPGDVWRMIFTEVAHDDVSRLLVLSVVCKDWKVLSEETLVPRFFDFVLHSNGLMRRYNSRAPLTTLNLGCNKTISDKTLRSLTNLTSLDLRNNSLITKSALRPLTGLTCLNLNFNKTITENFRNFTSLTQLHLDWNSQITLSGWTVTNLRALSLAGNKKVSNCSLAKLTRLTHLNIRRNNMINDNGITGLVNLTSLTIGSNTRITDAAISKLSNLIYLDLSFNGMITDHGISRMTNLRSLSLSHNEKIKTLRSLTGLTNLVLWANASVHTISYLSDLLSLSLGWNTVVLDRELSVLTQLTALNLLQNSVISNGGISGLTNLKTLGVSGKNTLTTNEGVLPLTNLTALNICQSRVTLDILPHLPNLYSLCVDETNLPLDRPIHSVVCNSNHWCAMNAI